ncbi:ribosomal protein S10p/S20e [Colletotrichum karsti]|uniref:Small ribosomal subunit protein uS10m n=1 Tax=Colletotrichum karsti TaxID=1095194 RepID=A0A9P6HTG8_9PEZI|nr:ribosomal protein S10p/S20e [Colletotrichum karsti]KAF9869362.1 ribosomal protein S10p/S20e [Colletotrichum karsti]
MRITSLLRPASRYTLRATSQIIIPRQPWHRCLATETPTGAFIEAAAEAGKTANEVSRPTPFGKISATADTSKTEHSKNEGQGRDEKDAKSKNELRFPRSVQALYLQPLRCEAEYGIPSCDLQLRSYSIRNLEFFSDFALRAAYYLKLPAFGPVPLPRITERWTVPRSSFIFKKSQENFERITLRRLIQIRDGNPETVQLWLAFLQKHAYYGIGMKANVWDFAKLGVGKSMDTVADDASKALESKFEHLSQHKNLDTVEKVEEFLARSRFNTDSGKRAEGARRFVEAQYKQEKSLTRKAAAKADS